MKAGRDVRMHKRSDATYWICAFAMNEGEDNQPWHRNHGCAARCRECC